MTVTVVATLGDSITAGTPGWDPDAMVRERTGAVDPESQYQHWAALAHPSLEFRNHGINRQRTDEIRLRLAVAAADAQAIVLQGGINDVVQGRPVEEAAADLRTMVRDARDRGLQVALANLLPWNNGGRDGAERVDALNALIAQTAAAEGVTVLPFHATLSDPSRPWSMPDAWTSDGNHPSVEGYRRLGERAFAPWW